MVFAVYDQGMRIQTPRKTLLGRRGIDALQKTSSTRRLADTDSDSSHLESLAERPFEQIKHSAINRRETAPPSDENTGAMINNTPPDLSRRALQAYTSTQSSRSQRPHVTAHMIMSTPIITAEFDQSLQEGWQVMQQHNVHHLVLLNRRNALMGMISDKDILRVTSGVGELELNGRSAADVMMGDLIRRKLLTVSPDTPILEIAHGMLEQGISALPVVTNRDELKGIITRTDLLQAILNGRLEAWF